MTAAKVGAWISNTGALLGVFAVIVSVVVWAARLQASVDNLTTVIVEIRSDQKAITVSLAQVWTRVEHERFVQDEHKPLEERVRRLESSHVRK